MADTNFPIDPQQRDVTPFAYNSSVDANYNKAKPMARPVFASSESDPRQTQSRGVVGAAYGGKPPKRRTWLGPCLAITGALAAFGCIAGIITFLMLPGYYRSLEPFAQEQWCVRVRDNLGSEMVCNWKATPEFDTIPTLESVTRDPEFDPLSILTQIPPSGLDPAETLPSESEPESGILPPMAAGHADVALAADNVNVTPFPLAVDIERTATPTATPTATLEPPTLTPIPTITPLPSPTPLPYPVRYKLDTGKITYNAQWWNNCGPATLTMALTYFGYRPDQGAAARYLKPNGEDKNVSPYQMVEYVTQQDYSPVPVSAMTRVGGDFDLLKRLISNEFPVIVEKGYDVNNLGWMGHYLFVIGYDDGERVFYTYDSFLGHGNSQGLREEYDHLAEHWRHFNNTFIVLYEPHRQVLLDHILGTRADPYGAAQHAAGVASEQINFDPSDHWAWFNLGHSYTLLGYYDRAAAAFDEAFNLGMPWRTLWYLHQPYTAYYAQGRYDDILSLTQTVERGTPYVEETFYYRGAVYAAQGKTNEALEQFNRALRFNTNFHAARTMRDALNDGAFNADLVLMIGVGG